MIINVGEVKQYGHFTQEADGRLSGHILFVYPPRRDGKIPCRHAFGSGKRINKLYSPEQLAVEVAKLFGRDNQSDT